MKTAADERPSGRFVIEMFHGRAYVVASLEEAFRLLRADAWACSDQTRKGYMHGVARRCLDWNKAIVRTDSVAHFLEDLERSGHITIRPLQ
jgi:hypothetical protein